MPGSEGMPDSPGFGKRQRRVSEPELSLNPHEMFLSGGRLDGYPPMADNEGKWS
jgi:hypothetical protein